MNTQSDGTRKVRLGHITGVFGIKGWIKVHSDTHPRENIVAYSRWYLGAADGPDPDQSGARERMVELESGRPQGKTIVAKLKGIETPEVAQKLIGSVISVNRDELPALENDEYYWADIVGFEVRDTNDQVLGIVDRLFETGANDVMVVRRKMDSSGADYRTDRKSDLEILIPWIRDSVILKVELADQLIKVDWDPDY